MDMKKILQAFDSASSGNTKSIAGINDMKRFVSIVAEGAKEELEKIENHPAAQDSPEIQKAVDDKKAELAREESVEEKADFPFAGKAVGHKEGPAGQWRNKGSKKNKPAKVGDLVGEGLTFRDYVNLIEASGKKMTAKNDPCWKGYKMVGTKKKGGKEVPNCVPGKKGD